MIDGLITLITSSTAVPGTAHENVLPRGYELPAFVIHQSGGMQEVDMAGPVGVREDDIQVDCYGRTAAEARRSGAAVRALLINTAEANPTLPDGTKVQRVTVDIDMAMPYKEDGAAQGVLARWLLKFHFTTKA